MQRMKPTTACHCVLMIMCWLLLTPAWSQEVQKDSPKVTANFSSTPLPEVLMALEEQCADYRFSFIYDEIEHMHVTATLEDRPLDRVLQLLEQMLTIRVSMEKHDVRIERLPVRESLVRGQVVNELGRLMASVNVVLLSLQDSAQVNGGVTDSLGCFDIYSSEHDLLVRASYVGYKTLSQRQRVGGNNLLFSMEPDSIRLADVSVEGHEPEVALRMEAMEDNALNRASSPNSLQMKTETLKCEHPDTGRDTLISRVNVYVDYLYTDTMLLCYYDQHRPEYGGHPLVYVPNEQIQFFTYDGDLFVPITFTERDGTTWHRFLRRYRDRKSRVPVYAMGRGRKHTRYFIFDADSLVVEIDDMVRFRDEERLARTGNHNYMRGFHWGILAGMMGNSQIQMLSEFSSPKQQGMTLGLWIDEPLYRYGTSLHVKALYHAMSAKPKGVALAYNSRGIDLPITVRQTLHDLPWRVIPFIEGGVNMRLCWTNSLESVANTYLPDTEDYPSYMQPTKLLDGMEKYEFHDRSLHFLPVVGGGLRWRINDSRHAFVTWNYYLTSLVGRIDTRNVVDVTKCEIQASGWTVTVGVGL